MPETDFKDDEDIVRAIASGDQAAFKGLFDAIGHDIFKTCYAILLDHQAAEDAVQEAFVKLWNNAAHWNAQASIKTWVTVVARNRCLDVLRKRKNDLKKYEDLYKDQLTQERAYSTIDEKALDDAAHEDMIKNAIFSLPERQREALSLVYYTELHNYEAAQAMGINVGAFDSLLARARRSLASKLEKHEDVLRGHFFDGT